MAFRVGIVGSGNWGTTVSKVIGENLSRSLLFEPEIKMWVYEEHINGEKLTDIINRKHENVKYLPGVKIPTCVRATPCLTEVVKDSTHLVFVLPHQFIESTCDKIAVHLKNGAVGISLIKGLIEDGKEVRMVSDIIRKKLGIHVSVLSGANIANEIAAEKFSTTTIGCDDEEVGNQWAALFSTPYLMVNVVPSTVPLEICGAVKNCIALAVGFAEALGYGNNTKATTVRVGMTEIIKFTKLFYPQCDNASFMASFGLDDVITTCYGGRNVKAAELFVSSGKSLEVIEREILNGQKLQGPSTIPIVFEEICKRGLKNEFPLLCYIHEVITGSTQASELANAIRKS